MTKQVLVIGAGVAGLAAIKACKEGNLDVVCYEKSKELGGLWHYHNDSLEGRASVMKSTVMNTSKEMSAFSDFPPPSDFPTFMHHSLVLKYLEMYAEYFNLLSHIHFSHEVIEIMPAEDYSDTGRWLVKVEDFHTNKVEEKIFDGVMICIGHHTYPFTPSFPNMDLFSGILMHSHNYKSHDGMEDKTIVVVGAGNSACDIAVDLTNVSKQVYLSTRRGSWIYPRLLSKGKPLDTILHRRHKTFLPAGYLATQLEKTLNERMDHERFGIKPFHHVSSQHPTINDEINFKLISGSILVKSIIKEFTEHGVIFTGEEQITPVDGVIFATGYEIKFPFISEDILKVGKNNKVVLYKNVFPPHLKHHTLGVIGLIQPSGPLAPAMELQSRWFVALMLNRCKLPSTEKMLAYAQKAEDFRERNYVQSQRHTLEVSWLSYIDDISKMIGAHPNMTNLLLRDPKLFKACFFGPCLPYQYRLNGPNKWEGAREVILNYKKRMYAHLGSYDVK